MSNDHGRLLSMTTDYLFFYLIKVRLHSPSVVVRWCSESEEFPNKFHCQFVLCKCTIIFFFTACKRGNIFRSACHSVYRGGRGVSMMSLAVWLPVLMFLPGGLWSHVPSGGVSVRETPSDRGSPVWKKADDAHPTGKLSVSNNFWRTWVPFVGPLIPLFWTAGDISGFQSQSG